MKNETGVKILEFLQTLKLNDEFPESHHVDEINQLMRVEVDLLSDNYEYEVSFVDKETHIGFKCTVISNCVYEAMKQAVANPKCIPHMTQYTKIIEVEIMRSI